MGLVDGTSLAIRTYANCRGEINIDGTGYGTGDNPNLCAVFFVDINGDEPPNKWGKDTFAFVYTKYDEQTENRLTAANRTYFYGFQPASQEAIDVIRKPTNRINENNKIRYEM